MSRDQSNQLTDPSADIITLHPLCEEDFPWLLMWMQKEDKASLSLLLQTTQNIREIVIITAIMNDRERVGLLTFYAAAFTRLRSPFVLQENEYSIQQVEVNPMIYKNPAVLPSLLMAGSNWLFTHRRAARIFWEMNSKENLWREFSQQAGFRPVTADSSPHPAFILYECSQPV